MTADAPPPAFRDELVAHLPQLRAFCRFLCRGRVADADDLAQETVLRAWAARKSFTPGSMMRAWLFVIARNLFYSAMRKNRFVGDIDSEQARQELKLNGSQEAISDLDEVRRAVELLPQHQREALVLVAAGGLSYEETAQICQCAVGTAKSRVNRARAALLKLLESGGGLPKSGASADTALDDLVRDAQRLAGDGQ
jgi:RNA polymerase sigma-70 factor (ECF subfamily)